MKCIDIIRGNLIAEVPVSATRLTSLILDKEYKRTFISNKANDIYIYDVSTVRKKL